MGEEKGSIPLQQILRSLCFKTEWKYAVFWKLRHSDRMILTWEEAYYDNNGPAYPSDHMPTDSTFEVMHGGHYLPDALGLAVEKFSHLVYSLGEGIIGQVAITGEHQWVFADKPSSCFLSPSECCDGWQSQFSAGIRTTAIVAIVPHGVVQLGSPNMITEDIQLVNHIKSAFCSLQSSSIESEVSSQRTGPEIANDFPPSSNKALSKKADIPSHLLPSLESCNNLSYNVLLLHGPNLHQNNSFEVFSEHLGFQSTKCGDDGTMMLHQPKSTILNLEQQKQMQMNVLNKEKRREENSSWSDIFIDSKHNKAPASYIFPTENSYSDHSIQQFHDKLDVGYDSAAIGSVDFDDTVHLQSGELELPEQLKMQLEKVYEQKSVMELSCVNTADSVLTFPAGCEPYKALGIAFKKGQGISAWDNSEKTAVIQNEVTERMVNSHLTTERGNEYLLETVMGIAGSASSNIKSEKSLFTSAESLLTIGKTSESSNHAKKCNSLDGGEFCHSSSILKDGTHQNLKQIGNSKKVFTERSSTESSFKTLSNHSKESELQLEPAKVVRKRPRPRQSCRPQPRDRQLIQDRVKELRELVPSGSKCSINSLLERTIKHMLFLQSVTKHTDKTKKCAISKFYGKKKGQARSSSHEHGSSWVVEVGSGTEACPIVIENLNTNGQMLVEMCEEGSHFLDIVEVLRSLGLTIINGVTEMRGEKFWASFIVEGKNNRCIHRMDILWALLRLLQPTTTIQ